MPTIIYEKRVMIASDNDLQPQPLNSISAKLLLVTQRGNILFSSTKSKPDVTTKTKCGNRHLRNN